VLRRACRWEIILFRANHTTNPRKPTASIAAVTPTAASETWELPALSGTDVALEAIREDITDPLTPVGGELITAVTVDGGIVVGKPLELVEETLSCTGVEVSRADDLVERFRVAVAGGWEVIPPTELVMVVECVKLVCVPSNGPAEGGSSVAIGGNNPIGPWGLRLRAKFL